MIAWYDATPPGGHGEPRRIGPIDFMVLILFPGMFPEYTPEPVIEIPRRKLRRRT